MRISLIDVDRNPAKAKAFPNLALMKIAAYHKSQGDSVEWHDPFMRYDIAYASKVFSFSPDIPYAVQADKVVRGGTGYDLRSELPAEIDLTQPDYSIYPGIDKRTSYGFLTRGCPNHCKWCVVPVKEGGVKPYMDIDDITLGGRRPYAVLMDNNILASDYGLEQIVKIADKGYHVDFNQALDARLVTPEIAQLLARCKWIGSIVRFGCDTPRQVADCERAMTLMKRYGYRGQWLAYCMLHGSIEECYERLTHWKVSEHAKKVRVVAQPFRDPFAAAHLPPPLSGSATWRDGQCEGNTTSPATSRPGAQGEASSAPSTLIPLWQKDMAHWATKHQLFASCDFKDFSHRKNFTCKQYFKTINQ